jgi:3-oxoacyl-[acyl-carrier protein] reductase
MYDLADKAVLVTGSTRGIGNAIARLLASHDAAVGVHGRDENTVGAVCRDIGPRAVPVVADLSDPENGAKLIEHFHAAAGRIDGLVNNAGSGRALAFRAMTVDTWEQTFRVNLEAAMMAARAAYEIMRKQGHGNIVNVASLAAHGPGKWMGADYAASKAGLVSLTRSLAFEAARHGIRVNAVSPGMVETDMTASRPEKNRKALNIPLDRLGTPEEIAHAVAFFLSEASGYITGQVLHVNGGLLM